MASGGARARSGPAPDPNALRRDRKDDAGWIILPAEGRKGNAPAWPLVEQSDREAGLWAEYWFKPQAILWERNGQDLEVALHVRTFAEAERPDASSSLRTLVRQQMDALLLTMPALLAARVKIQAEEPGKPEQVKAKKPAGQLSARQRLKVLNGGEG